MRTIIDAVLAPPLGYLMQLCLQLAKNYGLAIILFTLLTKILLSPLSIWTHKNSIKMIQIQPEMNLIKARNISDSQRALEEQHALYKRVHYKPMAGIIPMLIQIPIIIGLMSVISHPLQHLLHISTDIIELLAARTAELLQGTEIAEVSQLQIVNLIQDPLFNGQFASLGLPDTLAAIRGLDMHFGAIALGSVPAFGEAAAWHSGLNYMPLLACVSAFVLSWAQNVINVLQKEAGWFSRWGMAIFLSLFSLYFGCVVPAGVALYWIFSNLFAILVMLITYWIIPPRKYIDYAALNESKEILARSKAAMEESAETPEQKKRSREDYKRFCRTTGMQLIFYSEKSGFYRYYAAIIDLILSQSDIAIHYITSDPNDAVFRANNRRIIPYYMGERHLTLAFMKADADMMVMTMPDLEQFHLKRSYIRKDMEYVYLYHGVISGPRTVRKGATQHYDTLLCTGEEHILLEGMLEQYYGWKPRKIIACGYPLLDQMIEDYARIKPTLKNGKKHICIAPSYQPDNILDCCLPDLLQALRGHGFDVTVRPHPQYAKLYPDRLTQLQERCNAMADEDIRFETVFGANDTIFMSDLIITDWSSVGYEFAFATLRPVLFIDTPPKIINPDYAECDLENPPELYLRNMIGKSLLPEEVMSMALDLTEELLSRAEDYVPVILEARTKNISNIGHAAEVAADYIIQTITNKENKHEQSGKV